MKRFAILVVLLAAERAHAGECGSSSSDSSSDSSDDSSSDESSSSSSSEPAVPACVDTTDVHGFRNCTRFGTWGNTTSMPGFILELGTAVRQFAQPLRARSGSLSHDQESFSYRVVNPMAETDQLETAAVVSARVGVAIRHGFYVAGEAEFGAIAGAATHAEMTSEGDRGTPLIEQTSVTVTSALAVGGFRTRLGSLGVGVEAAGGFRLLSYNFSSQYHACETTMTLYETQEVLEARARAQYFVTPFVAVGATYGKSLIDDAWVGGIYIGGTTRAFGGN